MSFEENEFNQEPGRRSDLSGSVFYTIDEKPPTPFAYKVVAIVVVIAMLSTLIFPALVMLGRSQPNNCHRGTFGATHCHTEPIDHSHSIFA